jgi:aminomethyltransferase
LEAALPLYGHELGTDPDGHEIPIFACPLAKFGVSFSPLKGDFVGRHALTRQYAAFRKHPVQGFLAPWPICPGRSGRWRWPGAASPARGPKSTKKTAMVGYVTSGTMVPYWEFEGQGVHAGVSDRTRRRSICLAYLDSDILDEEPLSVEIRGKRVAAMAVPCHMRSESPPYTRPILL